MTPEEFYVRVAGNCKHCRESDIFGWACARDASKVIGCNQSNCRMKIKKGQIFMIGDHKMEVKSLTKTNYDEYRRVRLCCASHCCTTPLHVKMEMHEETLVRDFLNSEVIGGQWTTIQCCRCKDCYKVRSGKFHVIQACPYCKTQFTTE